MVRYAFRDAGHPRQGDDHFGRCRDVEERAVGPLVVQQPAHRIRAVPYGLALLQRLVDERRVVVGTGARARRDTVIKLLGTVSTRGGC